MLQCKSEYFRSSTKLVNGFMINTKEDLKEMAKMVDLSIPAKLRKAEYASQFADAILSCPEIWLAQLPRYELTLLQKLIDAGPNTYIEEPQTFFTTALETLSLVVTDYDYEEAGEIRYMICDELREVIAPHVTNMLTSKERENRYMIEQYMLGIINLFGFQSYQEVVKQLNEYIKDPQAKKEIPAVLSESILIRQYVFDLIIDDWNSESNMRSPFLFEMEDMLRELSKRPEIFLYESKKFTSEEVFQAGSLPCVSINNSYSDKLKQFMKKELGFTDEKIASTLHRLWFLSQTEDNALATILPSINVHLLSVDKLQKAVGLFSEYINHSPRWFLKGYSPAEASAILKKIKPMNKPPQLVAGASMKAAGMDVTPDLQDAFNEMFRERSSGPRVGRNDPCPCGSGKKYKKCCGRDN